MKIVAITSCPNGIAHTYMAQEKLEQVAKEMGVDIKVETQGGVGAENVLTTQDIEEADGVIIAADKQVDLSRFVGKRLINENVREGIHNPRGLIQRIINQDAPIYQSETNYHSKDRGKSKSGIQNGLSTFNERCIVYGSFYRSWWTPYRHRADSRR